MSRARPRRGRPARTPCRAVAPRRIELKEFFRGARVAWSSRSSFPVLLLVHLRVRLRPGHHPRRRRSAQYFLAGMVASGVVTAASSRWPSAITVERDGGTLKMLRGTPMPRAAYFVGKIGCRRGVAIIQIALLLSIGRCLLRRARCPTRPALAHLAWVALPRRPCRRPCWRIAFVRRRATPDAGPGRDHADRAGAPVHLRGLLRLHPAAALDAAHRRRSSRSSGSPRACARCSCPTPSRQRRPPALVAAGVGRRGAAHLDRHRGRALPAHVPLAAPRGRLTARYERTTP